MNPIGILKYKLHFRLETLESEVVNIVSGFLSTNAYNRTCHNMLSDLVVLITH